MWKGLFFMVLALLLFIVAMLTLGFLKYRTVQAGMAKGAAMAPPPPSVTTVVVKTQEWQPVLKAVGTLRAVHGVTVSTDMAGIVSEIAFESGSEVKKGTVLVKMDTEQEEAQIHISEARRDLAVQELARKKDLLDKKAISSSEYDTAESELRQAKATVDQMKAMTERKRITAPFDGVIGIRQVDLGQYLNPGAMIAPLQSLDPIYAEFSMPQQYLKDVQPGKKVRATAEGWDQPVEGEITAVDSQVNESTRNITVQATLANPERKLRPGMYVQVAVLQPEMEKIRAIPASSVNYAPYGDSVWVVKDGPDPGTDGKPQKIVELRPVTLGRAEGDLVSVKKGLAEGEEVVTAGVFRLRPNAPVTINNQSAQPGQERTPKPADT